MFYKSFSMMQLGYYYATNFSFDVTSLAMIAFGYALSASALKTLGVERTYFGAELGICDAKQTRAFPYNVLAHPMIVGNIIGLLGFTKMDGFRAAVPYLVPGHVFLFVCHMVQETVCDIYRKEGKLH